MTTRALYNPLPAGQTDIAVPTDYIDKAFIKLYRRPYSADTTSFAGTPLALGVDYTWLNSGTVRLTVAADGNTDYLVQRETQTLPITTQQPGVFSSSRVNLAHRQALHLAEEAKDLMEGTNDLALRSDFLSPLATKGSALLTYLPAGAGAITWSVQSKLRSLPKSPSEYSSFAAYLATVTPAFYPQNGGDILRAGRFMAGAAQRSDLLFPNVVKDWFSEFQIATDLPGDPDNGTLLAVQCASINDGTNSDTAAVAYMGAIQTRYFGSAGTSGIALMGVVVNNHPSLQTKAWAIYAEAHKINAVTGDTFCFEANTRTLVQSITPTPWQQGDVGILHLASGAGVMDQSNQFDASFAIQIVPNIKKFKRGIVFNHDSLTDGFAIELAAKGSQPHRIGWTNVAGFSAGAITSIVAGNGGQNLLFTDGGFQVNSVDGFANLRIVAVNSSLNFIQVQAAAGTSTPAISAASFVNPSVDLLLGTQGAAGRVQFGTFVSTSDVPIVGYYEMKTLDGVVRKVAIIN